MRTYTALIWAALENQRKAMHKIHIHMCTVKAVQTRTHMFELWWMVTNAEGSVSRDTYLFAKANT